MLCGSGVMFAALKIGSVHSVWSLDAENERDAADHMAVQSVIRKRVFMISSRRLCPQVEQFGKLGTDYNDMAVRVAINPRACEFRGGADRNII